MHALRHEGLRKADVDAALRRQNANDVADVETVSIEPGGAVVATLKPGLQSATKEDIDQLRRLIREDDADRLTRVEAKLDALLARQR
jgi:uncharacterized membrane protein YcaP (DUF421 family)